MTRFIGRFDTARQFTLQYTITHTLVFTVTSSLLCLVAASSGGRSPSSGFPNCLRPQLQLLKATVQND
jgi:hypothetical protein